MENNVTTSNTKKGIKWTEMDSRVIRTDLAAVFHMACHNLLVHPDTFVEYMETSHSVRFAVGRGSHAEEKISDRVWVHEVSWRYYEKAYLEDKPCIIISHTSHYSDNDRTSPSEVIYLDKQDETKLKEQLKEAIDCISMYLRDAFNIVV